MFPNTVAFDSTKTLSYYIKQAGGYGRRALKKKAFVVFQNGKVGDRDADLDAGCEIVVPSKPEHEPIKVGRLFRLMAMVFSAVTILLAVIK